MPPWNVIGIGATSVDYVYRLPARPEADGPNSKIRISSHTVSCGGQMATALAACATLGLRSKFAGVIGSDDNGTRVREALVARGVDVSDAVIHHGPNQFAVILVDDHTRTTPADLILPPLLEQLCEAGVRDEDITIMVTHGTHRLSTTRQTP